MNNRILTSCEPNVDKHTYNILGDLNVQVTVTDNPFHLPLDALFSMAARINKKRAFLFVSKVLGKHIPLHPYVSLVSGSALALLLHRELHGEEASAALLGDVLEDVMEGLQDPSKAEAAYLRLMELKMTLPTPITCIGFAETATALGHSVYHVFASGCSYVHTTREWVVEVESSINFEEEHSHAMSHRVYADLPLRCEHPIVLVDDEMTTGKTTVNIIRDLHQKYPRKKYYVAALLDWRSPADQARFRELEAELGISITTLALVKGEMKVEGGPVLDEQESVRRAPVDTELEVLDLRDRFAYVQASSLDASGWPNRAPYLQATGRFGIASEQNAELDASVTEVAHLLQAKRSGAQTLCLGTGEFMYIPMRIAAEMGEGVLYQSTTRSPIHPYPHAPYAVRDAHPYPSPEDPTVQNYLYNITLHEYDDCFVFLERQVEQERLAPFVNVLQSLGIKRVYLVILASESEGACS